MARIMVAEDDATLGKIMVKLLTKAGHEVLLCPNGRIAYEILQVNHRFDLLITDFMMPEMDGRELVRCVRGMEVYAKTPILIVSAVVRISDISDLLETGASQFMPKPIKGKELIETVVSMLD